MHVDELQSSGRSPTKNGDADSENRGEKVDDMTRTRRARMTTASGLTLRYNDFMRMDDRIYGVYGENMILIMQLSLNTEVQGRQSRNRLPIRPREETRPERN